MVIYLERGADLHMSQLMPLPLTVSCFSKIQIGFTFPVPAHPGSPGQRAVKRDVCVCSGFGACSLCNDRAFGALCLRYTAPPPTPSSRRCYATDVTASGWIIQPEVVWISTGARLEGPKLEPEGPRAQMGFPTADLGFRAFKALCLAFMAFKYLLFDACNIYPHQTWRKWRNDREGQGLHFITKHHAQRKILKHKLCRVVNPSKKVPALNCEVHDLLLEVVDLKQEVPDLRSGGIPPI